MREQNEDRKRVRQTISCSVLQEPLRRARGVSAPALPFSTSPSSPTDALRACFLRAVRAPPPFLYSRLRSPHSARSSALGQPRPSRASERPPPPPASPFCPPPFAPSRRCVARAETARSSPPRRLSRPLTGLQLFFLFFLRSLFPSPLSFRRGFHSSCRAARRRRPRACIEPPRRAGFYPARKPQSPRAPPFFAASPHPGAPLPVSDRAPLPSRSLPLAPLSSNPRPRGPSPRPPHARFLSTNRSFPPLAARIRAPAVVQRPGHVQAALRPPRTADSARAILAPLPPRPSDAAPPRSPPPAPPASLRRASAGPLLFFGVSMSGAPSHSVQTAPLAPLSFASFLLWRASVAPPSPLPSPTPFLSLSLSLRALLPRLSSSPSLHACFLSVHAP